MALKIVLIISYMDIRVLVRPNGIITCPKSTSLVQKTVFHLPPAVILMRSYLFFRSDLVNYFPLLVLPSNSLMTDRRYLFGIVRWSKDMKLMNSLGNLFFLHTNWMGAAAVV